MATAREATVSRIESTGVVAIIRAASAAGLIDTCQALKDGGVDAMEVTMTTPGALDCIRAASDRFGDEVLVGVGSVTDRPTVEAAVEAGARYVVSPVTKAEVIEASHASGVPVFAGAFTPTEILHATELGADLIKVFPANHNGPKFFSDVLAPMPHLKLTPTGGVDLSTVGAWFAAGARCVGVGSALVKKDLIQAGDFAGITKLAEAFMAAAKDARSKAAT